MPIRTFELSWWNHCFIIRCWTRSTNLSHSFGHSGACWTDWTTLISNLFTWSFGSAYSPWCYILCLDRCNSYNCNLWKLHFWRIIKLLINKLTYLFYFINSKPILICYVKEIDIENNFIYEKNINKIKK